MSSRALLAAASLVLLAAPGPGAVAQDPGSQQDLPPVLIRWPLDPVPRVRGVLPPPAAAPGPPASPPATPPPLPVAGDDEPAPPAEGPETVAPPPPADEAVAEAPPPEPPAGPSAPAVAPPTVVADAGEPALELPGVVPGSEITSLRPPTTEVRRWSHEDAGAVTWEAQTSRQEGDWIILQGQVDIRVGTERIQADDVRLNQVTRELQAEGNVVLDHLDARLTGSRLQFDLNTATGSVWDAYGVTGESLNFTGSRVDKVGPEKYVVHDGTFTSCTQPTPIYQIKASTAIIKLDRFVYLWNPRVHFKNVPAWYVPYAMFPIKQHRSTGFMVPKASNSSLRGFSVEEEFFWAINRTADMTFGGRVWDKYGWRGDLQGRWFGHGMKQHGFFDAAYVDTEDPDPEIVVSRLVPKTRYGLRFEHQQTFWDEWDFTARGEYGSDQLFDREFEPGDQRARYPIFNQRFSLQRRWGKHSLNIFAENDEREGVFTAPQPLVEGTSDPRGTDTNRNLPMVEYRASGLQPGGEWINLSMEGSVANVHRSTRQVVDYLDPGAAVDTVFRFGETLFAHDYLRADVYPQLSFPLGTSWLRVVPSINVRGTWWSRREGEQQFDTERLPPALARSDTITFTNTESLEKSLFLWGYDAQLRIEGPDFERTYNLDAEAGQRKWQHVIAPRIEFRYGPRIDADTCRLPSGEEKSLTRQECMTAGGEFLGMIQGDLRAGHYTQRFMRQEQRFAVGLANTFRSKRVPIGDEEPPTARDVVIWNLSTDYDLIEPLSRGSIGGDPQADPPVPADRTEVNWWGNVRSDVNFRPTDNIHFSLRNTWDVLQDDFTDSTLVGGVEGDWGYVDLSYRTQRDRATLTTRTAELTMTGEHWLYKNGRVRLGYDFTKTVSGEPTAIGAISGASDSSWLYRRFILSYFSQCAGVSLSWEQNNDRSVRSETEWTFIVTLRDLGNFIRYRDRTTR